MNFDSSPIFVVGCPRSGTTLMQAKLSAFDRISIPPEDDFILRFYDLQECEFESVLVEARVQFLLDDLYTHDGGTFENWLVTRAEIEALIGSYKNQITLKQLICVIYQAFLQRLENKTRWGCKVPYFAKHIDVLATIFPDAKFIHMLRDPRAVYQSMKDRRANGATHFPGNPADAAYLWRRLVAQAEFQGSNVDYFKVYYES